MLLASNKSLAEYNLSQEPALTEARVRLQERHREANRAAEQVKMARDRVREKAGTVEPDTMLALLQVGEEREEMFKRLALTIKMFLGCGRRGRGGERGHRGQLPPRQGLRGRRVP